MKIERIVCSECGYIVKPHKIRDEEIATILDGFSGNEIRKEIECLACGSNNFYIITEKGEENDKGLCE